jgi:hypothetical protein
VLQGHSRAINYSKNFNITGKTEVALSGAAVHVANTRLLLKGPTTISGHQQGAVALYYSTAKFQAAVTARNNQVTKEDPESPAFAALEFRNAQATFMSSFVCAGAQDMGKLQAVPVPAVKPSAMVTPCISASSSALDFRGTVTATNNLCTRGAPVLGCSRSEVRFRSRALFSGNNFNRSWTRSLGYWGYSDFDASGGAWKLRDCRVVADKWVVFANNTAVGLRRTSPINTTAGAGGAVSAQDSSLIFKSGLEVVGNTAPRGGGLFLAGSSLKVSGSSFVCKDNVAARQGGCMYAMSSAAVLLNSTSSFVQNNSAFNETVPSTDLGFTDESNGYTGACLAAVAIVDSKVNFGGLGHNFGNNLAADGRPGCDIVVFSAHNLSENVSDAGLTCNSAYNRTFGAYTVGGDVCAGNCSSSDCACPPPAKWTEAAGKCM